MARKIFNICLLALISIAIFVSVSFGEEQLVSEIYLFRFKEVSNIVKEFEKNISDKGKIEVNSQRNYLTITDVTSKIKFFNSMVKTLDIPSDQYLVKIIWLSASPVISEKPWGTSEIDASSMDGNKDKKELLDVLKQQAKNSNLKLLRSLEIPALPDKETILNVKSKTQGSELNVLPRIINEKRINLTLKWSIKMDFYGILASTNQGCDIELGKAALINLGKRKSTERIFTDNDEVKLITKETEIFMLIAVSKME